MKITKKAIKIVLLMLVLVSILSLTSALTIKDVSTNPVEIAPGESAIVKIEVENEADVDIKDVSLNLDLTNVPFAPFESSSEVSFDKIEEGEDETATFRIIALSNKDVESGIYKIPVEISYTEDDVVKTRGSLISVIINSDPVLGVDIEDDLFLKGRNEEVKIKIINKGLSDIRFVEVELGSSKKYNILSRKNVYVGDIESDDFNSVNFKVYFEKDIPDKINLPVIVTYEDVLGNRDSEEFNIRLNVYTKEKAIELGLMKRDYKWVYVGVVVVLIVGYFVYRWFKKQRKLKKLNASS